MKDSIYQIISKCITKLISFNRSYKVQLQIKTGVLTVGKCTYGINNLIIHTYKGSEAKVIIGKYTSLGPEIHLITGGIHPVGWISTFPFRVRWNISGKYEDGMPYTKGDVVIGNDVWIATGVRILSGVSIGDGAVIASFSIVTKSVPPYAIVAGNPARIIKFRFGNDQIKQLLILKWWDWDESLIKENIHFLSSDNIGLFLSRNKISEM